MFSVSRSNVGSAGWAAGAGAGASALVGGRLFGAELDRGGLGRRLARAQRTLATHDGVEAFVEPKSPLPTAGKGAHGVTPIGQIVALQQGPRRDQLVLAAQARAPTTGGGIASARSAWRSA